MAFTFSKSTPLTGSVAMYAFKEQLKASGWSVLSSSDSSTYNSSGDQIASGSSGANGLANTSAWIRLRSPAGVGGCQFILQRGVNNTLWRLKYSITAGFSGGSPSATQVPSATDEIILYGGGTDASPTYDSLFSTDNTYRWNVGSDSAAPYGFWGGAFPTGGGVPFSAIVHEPLTATDPSDANPYALYVSGSNAFLTNSISTESMSASSNILWSTTPSVSPTSSDWLFFSGLVMYVQSGGVLVVPANIPVNPINSNDQIFPIVLARRSALPTPSYKGVTTIMRWHSPNRTTGDTLTVSTARDRIIYGNLSLPWDGSVPTV
jgi:hypothetical protein